MFLNVLIASIWLLSNSVTISILSLCHNGETPPDPPKPERIEVYELQLPPVVEMDTEGSCTVDINPHKTGCLSKHGTLQSGNFLPDGRHVVASVTFAGAPNVPDPASIYTGLQVILIKTNDDVFPGGDSWKCITCGVPSEQQLGRNNDLDYPQAFSDGFRILAGANIIDCGSEALASATCIPEKVHIYPVRWSNTSDDSGFGGAIRELRLHPDNKHLGFNSFTLDSGQLGQFAYFSRLHFNRNPSTGLPLNPRYDLVNVTRLFNPEAPMPVYVSGNELIINASSISVGELRGFSGSGREVTYIGYPVESSNIDVFAADLETGVVRRLTSHPEYVDPVDISPDDAWTVVMDTRGTNRQMFLAGMRRIPPIIDVVTTSAVASTRNNGARRFFQPWLIDRFGDRSTYFGQKLNAAGDGSPGSINDPQWNGMADPKWSPDGTHIAYWQALTLPPACGGKNPLPCPLPARDGRVQRIMLASLKERRPYHLSSVQDASDTIPWGIPYLPGDADPVRTPLQAGNYTLKGKECGYADVLLENCDNSTTICTIAVTYYAFSDDDKDLLTGTEKATLTNVSPTLNLLDWYSDLVLTGEVISTKKTSADGVHLEIDVLKNIFSANGTMTTTVDGKVYEQPANGT